MGMNENISPRNEDKFPVLPDGSSFFTGSLPLPEDHWLYAPRCDKWDDNRDCVADCPPPILTHELRSYVVAAARYAIRAATAQGTTTDFDPDSLVQNTVIALCGHYFKSKEMVFKATVETTQ